MLDQFKWQSNDVFDTGLSKTKICTQIIEERKNYVYLGINSLLLLLKIYISTYDEN